VSFGTPLKVFGNTPATQNSKCFYAKQVRSLSLSLSLSLSRNGMMHRIDGQLYSAVWRMEQVCGFDEHSQWPQNCTIAIDVNGITLLKPFTEVRLDTHY